MHAAGSNDGNALWSHWYDSHPACWMLFGGASVTELSSSCLHMPDQWNRAAVFAYVMSTVSMLLTTLNTQSIRTQQQQRKLEGFCRSHHIPKPLATKLAGFYDFVLPRQVHSEDQEIIDALPSSLQQQVMRCPFLTACLC
jgi:hypothetical protein